MLEQHKQIVVKVNVGRVILAQSIANIVDVSNTSGIFAVFQYVLKTSG